MDFNNTIKTITTDHFEMFRSLAENSQDLIHRLDKNFNTIYINPRIKFYSGEEPFVFIGRNYLDFLPKEVAALWKNVYTEVFTECRVKEFTFEYNSSAGIRTMHIKVLPEFDTDGSIKSILSISRDITEIQNFSRQLEIKDNIFKISVDSLYQPFVILTPVYNDKREIVDFVYEYMNEAAGRSNNYPKTSTLGKRLLAIFPDHRKNGVLKNLIKVMNTGKSWEHIVEYDGPSGGSHLAGSFQINAAKAEDKLVVSWLDVTELIKVQNQLKTALTEKDILIKEIHHRVKNNLQIISSILRIQASYQVDEKIESIFNETQNRIKTIALVHEKLYRSDPLQIDFKLYTKDLCRFILNSFNARRISLDLDFETVQVPNSIVIVLGLITTELITNCIKHAFNKDEKGIIKISMKQNKDRIIYSMEDNGKGFPSDQQNISSSFGRELLSALVEQLEGEIEYNSGKGAKVSISFPAQ
jgi:PAS domain S-box-containing protein